MSLLTLAEGRAHLKVEADYPADQIQPYLDGADAAAMAFLNRMVYADAQALANAIAAVPADLAAAALARDAALEADRQTDDVAMRGFLCDSAHRQYASALDKADRVMRGMVVNDGIKTALRLLLGHLDENRESVARGIAVAELPQGVEFFLLPYRVGWGG